MSRPLRLEFPGSLWHITHRGNERRNIFVDHDDRSQFLDFLGEAVDRFRWILTAYALMLNHFHLVIELTEEATLSRGMKWLDGRYAQRFNWRHDRVGHLYQGRFGSILIEKATHDLEVLRYVVLNPVRANIEARPERYRWSSHQAVLGMVEGPVWLSVDRVLARFGDKRDFARERYRRFVEEGIGSTRCPWSDLVGQMYLGSEPWLEEIRKKIAAKPRASEHPRAQRDVVRPAMPQVISAVADAFGIPAETLREGHGGFPRMAAAWVAWQHGNVPGEQIATALRIRSAGRITQLVKECESDLARNARLRARVDECLATLGRKG